MRDLEVGPEGGRHDLYIVSENFQEEREVEEDETKERRQEVQDQETGGHINQSFAPSPDLEEEEEEEEGRERPGEINYTALSRATTAIGRKRGEELRTKREGRLRSHFQSSPADRYREKDPEPACFPLFRWSLMITGVILLLAVLVILAQLVLEFREKYQADQPESSTSTSLELSTENLANSDEK